MTTDSAACHSRLNTVLAMLAGLAVLAVTAPGSADAQEAATFFRQNCASCHTIGGGRLVGPDLENVSQRQEEAWLVDFIVNPQGLLAANDPYAMKLKQEAGGAVMPRISTMTPELARRLLDLIREESQLPESQFKGIDIGDEPFTEADIALGKSYFTGDRRLEKGGPSCLSCHTSGGLGGLGGGRLGPDLTQAYERLQGRKNLVAWLQAPATETMRPIYINAPLTQEEIVSLVAYLEDEALHDRPDPGHGQLAFLLLGLGGCVAGFVVADVVWRGRFRGVRRALVHRQGRERGPSPQERGEPT